MEIINFDEKLTNKGTTGSRITVIVVASQVYTNYTSWAYADSMLNGLFNASAMYHCTRSK